MFCTLQKIWRCYFSPSEKKLYSSLQKKNYIHHAYIDDVALRLSLQKFILGICTLGKLTFWTTTSFRKTSLLVLTPSENLIYLEGVEIKRKGPVLALKRKSKSAYTSFISDTVPYWWRGCSLVLQCFVENCREREIYVVVGSVLTRMSLDVSVECYFLSIMKHSPPTILLTNELLIIEYCF